MESGVREQLTIKNYKLKINSFEWRMENWKIIVFVLRCALVPLWHFFRELQIKNECF